MYLDNDYLVLQALDDLLTRSMVIGIETEFQICNGFLIAEPQAEFLQRWLSNYTDFRDHVWAEHSTMRPHLLARDFPHLVHVVDDFFKPNYRQIPDFTDRGKVATYDWANRRGLHLYSRLIKEHVFGSPRLDRQDSVIGDAVRLILYGDQNACNDTQITPTV